MFDAIEAIKNIIKAWEINIEPKTRNWRLVDMVSEKRKLGKYAMKNSRTFGLTKFMYRPLKNKFVFSNLASTLNLVFNSAYAK